MDEEKIENKKIKKPWNNPVFFFLHTKKTGSGPFEESYEDDRYNNPIASP